MKGFRQMAVAINNSSRRTSHVSPFWGFASLLWGRHCRSLPILGGYIAVLALIVHLIKLPLIVGLCSLAPIAFGVIYFGMASVGMTIGFVSAGSKYPTYLLRLPVTTRTLVLWPMMFGGGSVILILLSVGLTILAPMGIDIPLSPVLISLLLGILVCYQVVLWMPVRTDGLRILLSIALGMMLLLSASIPVFIAINGWPPFLAWLALACPFVIAYGVGVAGVSLARRGDVVEYPWAKRKVVPNEPNWVDPKTPFASPMAAELWYILCRQELGHLISMRNMIFWTLPVDLNPDLWFMKWLILLILLFSCAPNVSIRGRADQTLNAFVVTRPRSTSDLVASYVWSAKNSAFTRWVLALLLVCIVLVFSPHAGGFSGTAGTLLKCKMTPRLWACVVACVLAYWPLGWKMQIDNLYRGFMMGKVPTLMSVYEIVVGMSALVVCYFSYRSFHFFHQTLSALPLLFVSLAILKIIASAIILPKLVRSRLIQTHTLRTLGMVWLAIGVSLSVLLAYLLPITFSTPLVCASLAFLALPIVRFALAPLTLADNRHRS